MSLLFHGDCLEEMKNLDDNSIDLIFCDLPYGQISCEWDKKINLNDFWIQIMRIKKLNTPIFFTTTTKFGVDLITSAPKKCPFRYDLVWIKSSGAGFLSAKKMPMRKHEMIYVFYEKLPLYDLSSHKHKFIKEGKKTLGDNKVYSKIYGGREIHPHPNSAEGSRYDPPLPVSVVKEPEPEPESENCNYDVTKNTYGGGKKGRIKISKDKKDHQQKYDPPLPVSVVKEPEQINTLYGEVGRGKLDIPRNDRTSNYDPPLPVSVVKEPESKMILNEKSLYGPISIEDSKECGGHQQRYDPPLPVSVVKEPEPETYTGIYSKLPKTGSGKDAHSAQYDPPLPTTTLEIKSTRGKHSTEKPVELMKWILKYYSKEGDVVLDPTMGSGSTGISCKEMNRNFIGIEQNPEIYEVAVNRIEG